MDHVEDVTPHELRHAAIPNKTVDALTSRNLLALAVLTNFVRHAPQFGMTLSRLIAAAGTQGATVIRAAYNALIEDGYLVRVEYTRAGGRRASKSFVSRVPMSEDRLADIVRQFTPGKWVLVPYDSGEVRREQVLAAEVYCAQGGLRIDRDGLLSEHEKSRRAAPRVKVAREQPGPVRRDQGVA